MQAREFCLFHLDSKDIKMQFNCHVFSFEKAFRSIDRGKNNKNSSYMTAKPPRLILEIINNIFSLIYYLEWH